MQIEGSCTIGSVKSRVCLCVCIYIPCYARGRDETRMEKGWIGDWIVSKLIRRNNLRESDGI